MQSSILVLLTSWLLVFNAPKVLVDGKEVEFKAAQPQTVSGRTMVPLRGVFEAIGAYVEYDPANRIIKARRNNEEVELRLGERIAKKNGAEIMLDVMPKVISGTTMVPLRFLSESLGAKVDFDKPNNRINISTAGGDKPAGGGEGN